MICKRPEFFSRIAYFSALISNLGTPPDEPGNRSETSLNFPYHSLIKTRIAL